MIISETQRVGIDIELINKKVALIQHKFLTEPEISLIEKNNLQQLTLMWNCKEAVFKWYGNSGVDFKKNIMLKKISISDDHGIVECLFLKENPINLKINFIFIDQLCLAWVV